MVPLLLDFAQIPKGKSFALRGPSKAVETGGEDEDELEGENLGSGIVWGSKAWREGLKHWLALLEEMRNARSLFRQAEVKDLLTSRLLLDSDPAVQQAALACLLNWKDPDLVPYAENLQRLVAPKTARDEITHWDIGPEGGAVLAEHRGGLMRMVIHIMYPKLKKKATKQTSKATAGVPRAAVLGFLARMSPRELAPFFKLLLQPLSPAFRTGAPITDSGASQNEPSSRTWEEELESGVGPSFLERVDPDKLAAVPYKRRVGFLHMARELIDSWGEALLGPYLHGLLGVTVRILESAGRNGGVEDGAIQGGVESAEENGGAEDGINRWEGSGEWRRSAGDCSCGSRVRRTRLRRD